MKTLRGIYCYHCLFLCEETETQLLNDRTGQPDSRVPRVYTLHKNALLLILLWWFFAILSLYQVNTQHIKGDDEHISKDFLLFRYFIIKFLINVNFDLSGTNWIVSLAVVYQLIQV